MAEQEIIINGGEVGVKLLNEKVIVGLSESFNGRLEEMEDAILSVRRAIYNSTRARMIYDLMYKNPTPISLDDAYKLVQSIFNKSEHG